jgi:hypothetical protein
LDGWEAASVEKREVDEAEGEGDGCCERGERVRRRVMVLRVSRCEGLIVTGWEERMNEILSEVY